MHKFYFNECIPPSDISINDCAKALIETIKEYEALVKKNIGVDRGIILTNITDEIIICQHNLKSIISSIPDKDRAVRTLAFSYFTKFPISDYLKSTDFDDKIVEEEYQFETEDATNLAIAKFNNCFLFSLAVTSLLEKNDLQLIGNTELLTINNLFGKPSNTTYIESLINEINEEGLGLFERLKATLTNSIYTSTFEKAFKSESSDVQKSIIEMFAHARGRGLATPYYPDTKIIKDVTPDNNNKKARVYELRVYQPKALRVYFFEFENTVFISKLEYKASYKEEGSSAQAKDITRELTKIDNMIKTR